MVPGTLFVYGLFCLYANEARPVFHPRFASLPREKQFLDIQGSAWNGALGPIAEEITASRVTNVGLKLGGDSFEYPIWVYLRNRRFNGRIDYCYVDNATARLNQSASTPDVIIAKISEPPADVTRQFPYRSTHPPLMVLWAKPPPHSTP